MLFRSMTRAQGWRFIDIGMRIERALCLCTFLDCSLRSPEADNPSVLETVLEVADSTLTYRSRYNLLPNIAAVYDLVLLDDTNPRSLFFQINQLAQHFERLPREAESVTPQQKILRDCSSRLRTLDTRELAPRTVLRIGPVQCGCLCCKCSGNLDKRIGSRRCLCAQGIHECRQG